jgi:hypothetical protein
MQQPSLARALGFGLLIAMAGASVAAAQDRPPAAASQASRPSTPSPTPSRTLTGKERLGEKWTDEQRIDNCKVPVDKRGTKPRPDSCAKPPS